MLWTELYLMLLQDLCTRCFYPSSRSAQKRVQQIVQIYIQISQSTDVFPDHSGNTGPHLTSLHCHLALLNTCSTPRSETSLRVYLLVICLPLLAWRLCEDRDFALSLAVSKGSVRLNVCHTGDAQTQYVRNKGRNKLHLAPPEACEVPRAS